MTSGALAAVAVAAAAALAASIHLGGGRPAPVAPPPDAALLASALAQAPAPAAPGPAFDPATARFQAALRGLDVPLPAGGTFNGVRWEQGGDVTVAQMDGVLEFNAMCQWLRAWRDGRARPLAARILQAVPSWPALRAGPAGTLMTKLAVDVRSGRGTVSRQVLGGCDASHRREVAYARALGLAPSS